MSLVIKIGLKQNLELLVLALFVLSIFIVAPWGNYAVGDDFFYLTQIKALSLGQFTKSALIGPTFMLQAFMGFLWSRLFGLSYISLRILTMLISLADIMIFSKILKKLEIQDHLRLASLLVFAFNPYFYANSFNFMTENYFLFFVLLSLATFLSYLKKSDLKYLLMASILGGLSVMIRQYGVVLLVAYFITLLVIGKKDYKQFVYLLIPFVFFSTIGILWPKYVSTAEIKSEGLAQFFASPVQIYSKIFSVKLLPYIGYILLPFSYLALLQKKVKYRIILLLLALPLAYSFYKIDIFRIGNLFYLEGYQARLRINVRENVFNNIPFKVIIAYLTSLSCISFVTYIFERLYKWLKQEKWNISAVDPVFTVLSLMTVGFFTIVIITEAYFDRYFINFFIFLMLLLVWLLNQTKVHFSKVSYLLVFMMFTISFFIIYDYHSENKLKWDLADKLVQQQNINPYSIFVDNVYASTIQMDQTKNYKGFESQRPRNYAPTCFIQEYSKQNRNFLNEVLQKFQNKWYIQKYLKEPKIIEANDFKDKSHNFDKNDILLFDVPYSSPVYNILGKHMYVRAFCTKNTHSQ